MSNPEFKALSYVAFAVKEIDSWIDYLNSKIVKTETVRIDELKNKRFTFFSVPDDLPIELYELWL